MQTKNPHAIEIIESLTARAIQQGFGLSKQSMSRWRRDGIPARYLLEVRHMAARRGLPRPSIKGFDFHWPDGVSAELWEEL